MTSDKLILIGFLILFFVLLITLSIYLPRIIIKLKAKFFGLNISLSEAKFLQYCQCNHSKFFKNVKLIQNLEPISIEQLATHQISRGNLVNTREGIIELKKRDKVIDFSVLSAIDLADIDIKLAIDNSFKEQNIELKNINSSQLLIDYSVKYQLGFPHNFWEPNTLDVNKEKIKKKLEIFLPNWSEEDVIKTEYFIREYILPLAFLEKEIGKLIIDQEYKIKRKY